MCSVKINAKEHIYWILIFMYTCRCRSGSRTGVSARVIKMRLHIRRTHLHIHTWKNNKEKCEKLGKK